MTNGSSEPQLLVNNVPVKRYNNYFRRAICYRGYERNLEASAQVCYVYPLLLVERVDGIAPPPCKMKSQDDPQTPKHSLNVK